MQAPYGHEHEIEDGIKNADAETPSPKSFGVVRRPDRLVESRVVHDKNRRPNKKMKNQPPRTLKAGMGMRGQGLANGY